jgi:ubiquinone biosynthesis protein
VKLGQILSSGEGIFPTELVGEFKLCRDQVRPETFATVRRVLEEDLGAPLHEVFRDFDPVPLASASIAQVHRATLAQGAVPVVVKIQRPDIALTVARDLAVLTWLAPFLMGRIPVAALANPPALVELFAETISEELDFRLEADNMLDIARVVKSLGQSKVFVPRPHRSLVTKRVLVMEEVRGLPWGDVKAMKEAGMDTEELTRTVLLSFVEGALIHGVFHGDLHGGNLLVTDDARVALLDHGITGRFDERGRLAFLRLLMAASANDIVTQVEALCDLRALPDDIDVRQVIKDLQLDRTSFDVEAMSAEELSGELRHLAAGLLGYGARLPKELMLFVKNMFFIDGALATMAPDLELFGEITNTVMYFHQRHGDKIAREIGLEPHAEPLVDLAGLRVSLGYNESVQRLTHRDLQRRRELIAKRMEQRRRSKRPAGKK